MTVPESTLSTQLQMQVLSVLGELGQQIGVLQAQCTHIIKEQDAASIARVAIAERLNRIGAIEDELSRLRPLVMAHEEKHQRALGAVWSLRVAWGVITGGAGAAVVMGWKWLTGGTPHP